MIRIESDPPLEIRRSEELYAVFQGGESLTFIVPKKYKQKFRRQVERINRAETINRKIKGFLGDVTYFVYSAYVGLINQALIFRQKELKHAFLVYTTSWKYISSIGGEDIDANRIRITFRGEKSAESRHT